MFLFSFAASSARTVERFLPRSPKQINGNSSQHDSQTDRTVLGITIDHAKRNAGARSYEKQRCERVPGNRKRRSALNFTFSRNENGCRGQCEENYIYRDDVVQNLFVASGQRDDNGQRSLQRDREGRHARTIQFCETRKKQTIFGHSKINPRRSEHALAKETNRGNGD